ncbi:tensin-like isoform X2 [Pollicipes pollicipes]|uniref:tensin-like isoform X2 n=1 Tax=Pollicipes pollicipes TaxID=41117 RepID=UPI0018859552|nr:tensin-like isoform X2 [Pollicipes pollicipes]
MVAATCVDAAERPAHTEGPLDGSLYATVIKKPSTGSPRSQPPSAAAAADSHELHTVSMDSGISSSGRERLSGGSSHSPSGPHSSSSGRSAPCDSSPLAAPETSPATPARPALRTAVEANARVKKQSSVDATQLDAVLEGLRENCSNIPDLRPCQTPAPDIDAIQAPTFAASAPAPSARPSVRGRSAAAAHSAPDVVDVSFSSGYGSTQSPPQPAPPASMVHYNGYKSDSTFSESFSAKAEEEIPYHARADSKPFSYASFGASGARRSLSPAAPARQRSPELEPPRRADAEQRRPELESPRLVRKLLVSGASQPAAKQPTPTPPSPSLPRKTYTQDLPKTYTNGSSGKSVVTETYGRSFNGGGVKAPATDTLRSQRSYNSDTLPSHRSYNTDTMKSYNTDTLRSNTSYNTDTLKSNRSYDWESTIRSTKPSPPAPAAAPAASRAMEPYRRAPPPARNIDINLNDPSAKTVTTYDQNTNSMTTVSTQSFDVPCSPNPTRKIVETTKRYMVDDEDGGQAGVTKMEETIREFVIEDLPDGVASAGNVTWLQKQQQKLRERKQAQLRSERAPKEARVLHELRRRQGQEDGYTSDTTLWTDTSRETSPAAQLAPLHVHTSGTRSGSSAPVSPQLPARAASRERSVSTHRYTQQASAARPLTRHRSETAYDRDRPHVQVVRPDQRKVSDSDLTHLINTTQYSQYSSTPVHDRDGLLTIVNGQSGVRDPPEPRPETPAFPNPPKTPYQNQTLPPKSPTSQRKLLTVTQTTKTYTRTAGGGVAPRERSPSPGGQQVHFETTTSFESSPSAYQGHSRRSSVSSDTEVISAHPHFVKDISKWWYKPAISREQAVTLLRDKPAGSFVIRDSNSFPGAFGLALKVDTPPANVAARGGDASSELVRHFLIETTSKGVRLKGCPNEPTFGTLSALVYQHSVTPLALPTKLALPETELAAGDVTDAPPAVHAKHRDLLDTGAACSVLYLYSRDTEALTGPQAVRRAVTDLFRQQQPQPEGVVVHFKVSNQGITLTDSQRKQFFRRHYNTNLVSHCGLDPEDRRWTLRGDDGQPLGSLRIFGFVAKKGPSTGNNQCHLFAEYDSDQPASAIVNFVTNIMMTNNYGSRPNML